jgi:hypothetical protein
MSHMFLSEGRTFFACTDHLAPRHGSASSRMVASRLAVAFRGRFYGQGGHISGFRPVFDELHRSPCEHWLEMLNSVILLSRNRFILLP